MRSISYSAKVKIVSYGLPVLVMGVFAAFGTHATRSLFAQSPSAASAIQLSLSQSSYTIGQDVSVMVSNLSDTATYVVNNCPEESLDVSRLEGAAWTPLQDHTDVSKCIGEPSEYEIPAHSSIKVDYKFWPELFNVPGEYRIHADIEPSTSGPTVEFSVAQ